MPIQDLRVNLTPSEKDKDMKGRKEVLSKILQGRWSSLYKGEGIEFAGFRRYTSADDAELIDWKASLRTDKLVVREFEELKNYTVIFLLDVSDSMLFTSQDKLKVEYAAELTYDLADAVQKTGDSVGLIMFNDDIAARVDSRVGAGVMNAFETVLSDGENYGGGFNLRKPVTLARDMVGDRAVMVIVSDFFGIEGDWEKYIYMMSQEFEMLGININDPRDINFPDSGGQFLLEHPYKDENIYVDVQEYKEKYDEIAMEEHDYVQNVFRNAKGELLQIRTDKDYMTELIRFFQRKKKGRGV